MSTRCSATSCLNGNCIGCRNGVKYCGDPRCFPNCPECTGETSLLCVNKRDNWDWTLVVIIAVLSIVLLLVLCYIIWAWYHPSTDQVSNQVPTQVPNQVYYQTPVYQTVSSPRTYQGPPPAYQMASSSGTSPRTYSRSVDASLNIPSNISPSNISPSNISSSNIRPSGMAPVGIRDPTNISVASANTSGSLSGSLPSGSTSGSSGLLPTPSVISNSMSGITEMNNLPRMADLPRMTETREFTSF